MNDARAKLDWFKAIILPHQSALRSRLRRIMPKSAELDDLMSEVLTRAYSNANWYQITSGRPYLFAIARNLVIDISRRQRVVSFETISELDILQSGYDLNAQLSARDELRRMQTVLEQMTPQLRRIFLLRRVLGKSLTEIAADTGLSVSTIEKHLSKAIRLFMKAMGEWEIFEVDGEPTLSVREG